MNKLTNQRWMVASILPEAVDQLLLDSKPISYLGPSSERPTHPHQYGVTGVIDPGSLQDLRGKLFAELDSKEDRPVVLYVNSPGGSAQGCFETAEVVRRLAAKRQVIAVAEGACCSAAYHIVSGATKIIASPGCFVGSCGTIGALVDESAMLESQGVKIVYVASAAAKTTGQPGKAVTEEDITRLQARVDSLNSQFRLSLGSSPRLSELQVSNAMKAEVYLAEDAKEHGLVDEVMLAEEAISEVAGSIVDRYEYLQSSEALAKFNELINEQVSLLQSRGQVGNLRRAAEEEVRSSVPRVAELRDQEVAARQESRAMSYRLMKYGN